MRGVVDDVRIYDSALSAKKVKKIHDKGIKGLANYDFNALNGSDAPQFTNVEGQDNWTSNGFIFSDPIPSWFVGITDTLGFDGTEALRFQRIGSGFGADASRLNDESFKFKKMKKQSYLHADFGYDANEDGVARKTDSTEIGPTLLIGCRNVSGGEVGVRLIDAVGNTTLVPITVVSDGSGCGEWIRLRVGNGPESQRQARRRVSLVSKPD